MVTSTEIASPCPFNTAACRLIQETVKEGTRKKREKQEKNAEKRGKPVTYAVVPLFDLIFTSAPA